MTTISLEDRIKLKREEYETYLANKRARRLGRGSIYLQRNLKQKRMSRADYLKAAEEVVEALRPNK